MLPGKPSLGETANEFGELRGQTGEQTGAPKSGDRIILFWPEGDQHLLSAGDARTLCRIRPTKISLLVVRAPSLGIRRGLHAVVSARFGVWPLATASGPRLCVASAGAGKAVGPSMPIAQQISLAIDHAFDERAVIVRSQGPKLSVFCGQRRHIDLPSRAGCGASARSSHGDDRGLSSPTDVPLSGQRPKTIRSAPLPARQASLRDPDIAAFSANYDKG